MEKFPIKQSPIFLRMKQYGTTEEEGKLFVQLFDLTTKFIK